MKRITAWVLLLGMALSVPAFGRSHSKQTRAQKNADKSYKKYSKQQTKMQNKQLKAQKKQSKKWNKNHQTVTTVT